MYCLLDDLLTLNSLWMLRPIKKNASIQMIYYAFDRTCKVTVFFNCLNTFCKIWLIASKLNTQANKTTLGNKPFTSMSNWNSAIETQQFFVKMALWCQNETHLHHMNTLSDQQQHTGLLYIKHCSLSCSLFLFSSTEGTFSPQPKYQILRD